MKLREVRIKTEMSQCEVAKRAGMSQALVSMIENGYHKPSTKQKANIVKALACHPKLINWEENEK